MTHRDRVLFAPLLALGMMMAIMPGSLRAQESQDRAPSLQSQAEQLVMDALKRAMDLVSSLGSWVPYELPEQLPNGDIIIRRKPPLPPGGGPLGTTQL